MRPWLPLLLIALLLSDPRLALAQEDGLMPQSGADFSAWRADAEVWGWSKDFKEMAAVALEIKRYPLGKQRGEVFMLIFDIGNPVPKENVHVLYHTQADMPHDPIPIPDIRERIWGIDVQYQNMWPRRPKRKWFRGAMKVEPIWELPEIEPGFCQPLVGFILSYRGKRAYQPHVPLRLKAPCDLLHMTDYRTYWARKDLGACMIRFDYSHNPANEESLRYPLATSWKLAHPLKILVRAADPPAALAEITKKLEGYGAVKTEQTAKPVGTTTVTFLEDDRWLAYRIARELHGTLGDPRDTGPNIVIDLGAPGGEPAVTTPSGEKAPPAIPDPMSEELKRQDELDKALDSGRSL